VTEAEANAESLHDSSPAISAVRVADAFGLSVAELAEILGRSRQAVSKAPAADALQKDLRAFERVARLRAIVEPAEFRHWLRSECPDLEGSTPLEQIRKGRVGVVADLVEDLLTGSPA
jgi:acetyl-CoA acetyltransferase